MAILENISIEKLSNGESWMIILDDDFEEDINEFAGKPLICTFNDMVDVYYEEDEF
ncbi:MAG: hypothetical protein AB7D96_07605 [Arcobacteraceae bacterium]|jgi:hypothetical protein